jgi:hypothetical protein
MLPGEHFLWGITWEMLPMRHGVSLGNNFVGCGIAPGEYFLWGAIWGHFLCVTRGSLL